MSEIMLLGMPYNLHTMEANNSTTLTAEKFVGSMPKWAVLENLSTTTKITK